MTLANYLPRQIFFCGIVIGESNKSKARVSIVLN